MKKILVALDYSPAANKVAKVGYQLAQSMDGEMVLLHVLADYTYYSNLEYSPIMGFSSFNNYHFNDNTSPEELESATREFLNKTAVHFCDSCIKSEIRHGDAASQILAAANEMQADVIVIGSHSRTEIDKLLMGSVTSAVLNKTTVPMFIVPIREASNE